MAVTAEIDKPTAAQYNSIQSTINTVLSTRYGQTLASSALTLPGTSTKITSAAWTNLRSDILKANRHQLNPAAVGTLTNPTTDTKIAAADYNAYETMANNCLTNYLLFPDNSTLSTSENLTTLIHTSSSFAWGVSGSNTLVKLISINAAAPGATFPYFFNTGGQIRINTTFTGGTVATVGTKDFSWRSAAVEMGTVIIGANSTRTLAGASGPGTGSAIGAYQLTSTDQVLYTKTTSTYTPNNIRISGRYATPNQIVLRIDYIDSNDPGGTYTIDEPVTATVTTSYTLFYASGAGEVDATTWKPTLGTTNAVSANRYEVINT